MKINFTKGLMTLIAVALSLGLTAQVGVEYIWGGPNSTGAEYDNSTFNGGLNDWTTEGLESATQDSAHNAIWRWDENGQMADGTWWGGNGTIESPSVSNGAVGFDSDYYDNSGLAPYPQKSILTSPSMDCTGEAEVSVLFYESYRQWNATSKLEVSNDGGNTWVPYAIPFNDDISSNLPTGGDAWTYVNITPTAANQSDVRLRFVWEGGYYYWILDDVALIKSPQNDLAIVDFFYPAAAYSQSSMTGVSCDSMGFNCTIRNVAKVTRNDITVYVNVSDDSGVVYTDSVELLELLGDSEDTLITFDGLWSPGNVEGGYSIVYSVKDAEQDFNPGDNNDGQNYEISNKTFAMGPGLGSYPYPAADITSFFAEGSFYNTCDFDHDGLEVALDSLGFSVRMRDLDALAGATVETWIKKVIVDSLKYPDVTMTAAMTENDGIGWEQKGYAEFTFDNDDQENTMVWVTEFSDLFGDAVNVI